MSQTHRIVVEHTFHGGRFDDGGLDIETLPDLICYKKLLNKVAEELWRRNNPTRERLPRQFAESLTLKFYTVTPNCVTIPLERALSADERSKLFTASDELDDAVDLVADAIEAAAADRPLPDAFPKHLLSLFREYGSTLQDGEWIEQRPAKRVTAVRYDTGIRDRLVAAADKAYDDAVDVIGQVTMARVSKPRMALELPDGHEVEAAFRPEDEAVILTALKEHQTAKLRVVGRGQFNSEAVLQRIVEVSTIELLPAGVETFDASAKPIWEQFAEVLAEVPESELAKLPTDGAERHDFYIYGNGSAE
jgi:hypothetical protein